MTSVFIIAEAGVNHNGSVALARDLIDAAVDAGVDAVKFQTWRTELLVTSDSPMANYQIENTGRVETQYEMLKRLELSYDDFRGLKQYCDKRNIMFMSTPDEPISATFLNELVSIFKIGSGELTNHPFLRHIARMGKPIILSTGMGTLEDVGLAVNVILSEGILTEHLTLLHANTQYPTPVEDVNLRAMLLMQEQFNVRVGYSDHTLGIVVPIAAVALGAVVIEKHFTLSKTLDGPDHAASLEPHELKEMVRSIRQAEKVLGLAIKQPSPSEKDNQAIVRKSIVACRDIRQGEKLSDENMAIRRPGTGLSPSLWEKVIGSFAVRDFRKDECIEI